MGDGGVGSRFTYTSIQNVVSVYYVRVYPPVKNFAQRLVNESTAVIPLNALEKGTVSFAGSHSHSDT